MNVCNSYRAQNGIDKEGHWPIKWENKRNMTKTLLYPLRNIDTQKPHFCTQGMPLSSIFTEFSTKNHFFIEKNLTPPRPQPNVNVKFYNPKHDRAYTADEWEIIMTDGREALEKALRVVSQDPKMFS